MPMAMIKLKIPLGVVLSPSILCSFAPLLPISAGTSLRHTHVLLKCFKIYALGFAALVSTRISFDTFVRFCSSNFSISSSEKFSSA
jgi:hypothetical protein